MLAVLKHKCWCFILLLKWTCQAKTGWRGWPARKVLLCIIIPLRVSSLMFHIWLGGQTLY